MGDGDGVLAVLLASAAGFWHLRAERGEGIRVSVVGRRGLCEGWRFGWGLFLERMGWRRGVGLSVGIDWLDM